MAQAVMRTVGALLAAGLAGGCALQPVMKTAAAHPAMLRSPVSIEQAVSAVERCISAKVRASGVDAQAVMVGSFFAESSNGASGKGQPQVSLTGFATTHLATLGFRPIVARDFSTGAVSLHDISTRFRPDVLIVGHVDGVDPLVSRERELLEGGIAGGGGRGFFSGDASRDRVVSVGKVTIGVELRTPVRSGKETLYPTVVARNVQAEYRLEQVNGRIGGAVVIGGGAGAAVERVAVFDVQSATQLAFRVGIAWVLNRHYALGCAPANGV